MSDRKWALLFCVPSLLFLGLFYYYPVILALRYSLYIWDGVNETFAGFSNFARMFRDEWLVDSLGNMVVLIFLRLAVALTAPLLMAILVSRVRQGRMRYSYRIAFVVPMVVTHVVVIIIWQFIYDYNTGLLNELFKILGLGAFKSNWLGDPALALYAIGLIGFPWITSFNYGLYFLMYSAGLDNIPGEYHEAAIVDGASSFKRLLHIDLPLLRGQVKMVTVLLTINSIQYFVPILIMTKGGPGTATMVPGLVMYYNGFQFGKLGYASTIGVFLFTLIFVISYLNMRFLKSSVHAE
jgi:raffinose/stachyose/melibiose transport system permease protein